MKFTAIIYTLVAAAAVSASAVPAEIQARDVCGGSSGPDQRRTNSPCESSNGGVLFCGCDRTDVVQCQRGYWTQVQDCGGPSCHGNPNGGAVCT